MVFTEIILVLAVAATALALGRLIGLPPIAAYLLGGVLAGPGGLDLLRSTESLEQVAEIGVALLLFGVGIEFSLDRMRRMLGRMTASGGAQVSITIALTAAAFHWVGHGWPVAVFLGLLVSLSSTAIVFKLYTDSGEIDAPQGQTAAGILLFQDLAIVPMILLIPALVGPTEGIVGRSAIALGTAAAVLAVIVILARAVLPKLLELVARARMPELFPLAALVAALGTALLALQLGLSLPIGAFLAGLAISGSRYAHQVFADVMPFRDVFVAIFFTSIGLLFDASAVIAVPVLFAALVGASLMKGIVTGGVVALLWRSRELGIVTGLGLAQIGEFSFVLAHQGVQVGLMSRELEQAFLGAAILTMAATPLFVGAGKRLRRVGEQREGRDPSRELRDHVLVIGYGQTGQAVSRALREMGLAFEAVDILAENVEVGLRDGVSIHFGDASRRAVLDAMSASRARAAVVTVGEPAATRRIVALLRQGSETLRVIVRARRVNEISELERIGADDVIPSEFETSIEILVRLLQHLGVPRHVVRIQESLIRAEHYRALRGLGTTAELLGDIRKIVAGGLIEVVHLAQGSPAAGRTLAELELQRRLGVVVLSVVREEQPLPAPGGDTRLEAGDVIVIYGAHESLDDALELFEAPHGEGDAPR